MTLKPIIGAYGDLFAIFGCRKVNCDEMDIDQNYLQTGTAIGSRASHEH